MTGAGEREAVTPWGALPDGTAARLFTLRNARGATVRVSDLGATLVSWLAPDRSGHASEVLLGHDTPAGYLAAGAYMGALVGRWANRIARARFELDGVEYRLEPNEGEKLLHGGPHGFHRALWRAERDGDALVMRVESRDGEGGFPGRLDVQVRYALDDEGALSIDYLATADRPTPVNLTSHPYFNLCTQAGRDVRGHLARIDADAFFEVDAHLIPERIASVDGSPFDFRHEASIGSRLAVPHPQLAQAKGFDHCYVLRGAEAGAPVRTVAAIREPDSGRMLTVSTDQAGLQFYTGNYLDGVRGRYGRIYVRHAGFCVEAGGFPNQINMADRSGVIATPDQPYTQRTVYRIDTFD